MPGLLELLAKAKPDALASMQRNNMPVRPPPPELRHPREAQRGAELTSMGDFIDKSGGITLAEMPSGPAGKLQRLALSKLGPRGAKDDAVGFMLSDGRVTGKAGLLHDEAAFAVLNKRDPSEILRSTTSSSGAYPRGISGSSDKLLQSGAIRVVPQTSPMVRNKSILFETAGTPTSEQIREMAQMSKGMDKMTVATGSGNKQQLFDFNSVGELMRFFQ